MMYVPLIIIYKTYMVQGGHLKYAFENNWHIKPKFPCVFLFRMNPILFLKVHFRGNIRYSNIASLWCLNADGLKMNHRGLNGSEGLSRHEVFIFYEAGLLLHKLLGILTF